MRVWDLLFLMLFVLWHPMLECPVRHVVSSGNNITCIRGCQGSLGQRMEMHKVVAMRGCIDTPRPRPWIVLSGGY